MWSKRREDELPQRPESRPSTAPTSAPQMEPQRRESNTMATPHRTFEPETGTRGGPAILGKNVTVKGQIFAREIVIQGSIHGNVDATDKIDIKKEAKLVGDIKTSRIVIEDGAYFKGSIDISKATPAKGAPENTPQPRLQPNSQPAPPATPTTVGAGSSLLK